MSYNINPDFNFDEWQEKLSQRMRGKVKVIRTPMAEEKALGVLGNQSCTTTELREKLRHAGASRDEADDLIKRLVLDGKWQRWKPEFKNAPTFIGTPQAIKQRQSAVAEQQQGKLAVA